jgi:hypothetical protein
MMDTRPLSVDTEKLPWIPLGPGEDFKPDVPVGWPTRFEIATFDLWLVVAAWCAMTVAARAGSQERP